MTAPAMMARKVVSSRMPLPQESSLSGSSSGSRPYFAGPKKAACVLARKITANAMRELPRVKAYMAKSMAQTSKILVAMATLRLLKRSARNPPAIENNRNGRAKRLPMTKTRKSFCESVGWVPRIRKMTKNFRPLSLKAPWNCVAIRLQKPSRQFCSGRGMKRFSLAAIEAHPSVRIRTHEWQLV